LCTLHGPLRVFIPLGPFQVLLWKETTWSSSSTFSPPHEFAFFRNSCLHPIISTLFASYFLQATDQSLFDMTSLLRSSIFFGPEGLLSPTKEGLSFFYRYLYLLNYKIPPCLPSSGNLARLLPTLNSLLRSSPSSLKGNRNSVPPLPPPISFFL